MEQVPKLSLTGEQNGVLASSSVSTLPTLLPRTEEPKPTSKACSVCHISISDENNQVVSCVKCDRSYHQSCHQPVVHTEDLRKVGFDFYCAFCSFHTSLILRSNAIGYNPLDSGDSRKNPVPSHKRPRLEINVADCRDEGFMFRKPRLSIGVEKLEKENVSLSKAIEAMTQEQEKLEQFVKRKEQDLEHAIQQLKEQKESYEQQLAEYRSRDEIVTLARHQVTEVRRQLQENEKRMGEQAEALSKLEAKTSEDQRCIKDLEHALAKEQKKNRRLNAGIQSSLRSLIEFPDVGSSGDELGA